jgi:hypothetical protein
MSMVPKNVKRFSGDIMRRIGRMMPKGVKRCSDPIMRSIRGHA